MCRENKNKSCILNVGNSHLLKENGDMPDNIKVSAHTMPINSMQTAKKENGCYFNTDNTYIQAEAAYPINPGRQIW